jgi:hypothetical protein
MIGILPCMNIVIVVGGRFTKLLNIVINDVDLPILAQLTKEWFG